MADSGNGIIWKVAVATGEVTTLAGYPVEAGDVDGKGIAARFDDPRGLGFHGAGNLFVADPGNGTILKVDLATGVVTTVAGNAGQSDVAPGPLPASVGGATGPAFGPGPTLFVSETNESVVLELH